MLEHLTVTEDREIFFNVEERPCYYSHPVQEHLNIVLGGEGVCSHTGTLVPDKKVLTRNGDYLSTTNKNYRVVLNGEVLLPLQKQMINFFDPSVLHNVKIQDTVLKNGRVCWAEYTFPDIASGITTKTGHSTSFKLRFILKNTFDGSGSVLLYSGDIDTFCTNGMISGSYDVTRKRHTKNFTTEGFILAFGKSMDRHHEQVIKYQQWADTQVSTVKVKQLLDKLTKAPDQRKRKNILSDRLLAQFTDEADVRGGNVFALSSALTAYASHNSERFPLTKRGDDLSLLKRQEQVGKWLSSDVWDEFVSSEKLVKSYV
tara:strand:+ start:1162 stop:2106 length:945 start_codon:yes stop_codon:yes gene_type:complete